MGRIKAILFLDEQAPAPDLKKKLNSFVEGGGTLIVQAKYPAPAGLLAKSDPLRRWNLFAIGEGRSPWPRTRAWTPTS